MWEGLTFWGLLISSLYIHSSRCPTSVLAQPEKFDCRTQSAWLCLLLAEGFSASSLYQEPRSDWEKELNPHLRAVGREEARNLQTLPRAGSAATKEGMALAASS